MYKIIAPGIKKTTASTRSSQSYDCTILLDQQELMAMGKKEVARQCGNKVAYLVDGQATLEREQLNVKIPPFCATSHSAMATVLSGIEELWAKRKHDVGMQYSIDEFIAAQLSPESDFIQTLLTDLQHRYKPGTVLMIRSSSNEDSKKSSNAGGNDSESNVKLTPEDLSKAYIKVIQSYFASKSVKQRKLGKEDPYAKLPILSVLIQEMIQGTTGPEPAVSGGVLVTRETSGQVDRVMQLEGVLGHCEGLVNASLNKQVPHDTYLMGETWSVSRVVPKTMKVAVDDDKKTDCFPVGTDYQTQPAFEDEDLATLFKLGTAMKRSHSDRDMDIEVVKDLRTGQLYMVQQRPLLLPKKRKPQYVSRKGLSEDKISHCKVHSSNLQVAELNSQADYYTSEDPEAALEYVLNEQEKDPSCHLPKVIKCRHHLASLSHEMMILRSLGIIVISEDNNRIQELLDTHQTVFIDPAQALIIEAKAEEIEIKEGRITHPLKLWSSSVSCRTKPTWAPVSLESVRPSLPESLCELRTACLRKDTPTVQRLLNGLYATLHACKEKLRHHYEESESTFETIEQLMNCIKTSYDSLGENHSDREGELLLLMNQLEVLLYQQSNDTKEKSISDYLTLQEKFEKYNDKYRVRNPVIIKVAVECERIIEEQLPNSPLTKSIADAMIEREVNERTFQAALIAMKNAKKLKTFLFKHRDITDYTALKTAADEYVDSFETTLRETRNLRDLLTKTRQGSSGLLLARRKTSCRYITENAQSILGFAGKAAELLASTAPNAKDLLIREYVEMIHSMDRTIKLTTTANQEMDIEERVSLRITLLTQFRELFQFCETFIEDILVDLGEFSPSPRTHRLHTQFQKLLDGVAYHADLYEHYLKMDWETDIAVLRPSTEFSVQHWQLGNAFWQNRNYKDIPKVQKENGSWVIPAFAIVPPQTLEDVFTAIHQSMLAVAGQILTFHSRELIERAPRFKDLYQVVTQEIFPTDQDGEGSTTSFGIAAKTLEETEHGIYMACNIPLRTHSAELTVDYHEDQDFALFDFNFTGANEQNRVEAMQLMLYYMEAANVISDVRCESKGSGRSTANHMIFKIALPQSDYDTALADLILIVRGLCMISFTFTSDIEEGFLDQCQKNPGKKRLQEKHLELLALFPEFTELSEVIEFMPQQLCRLYNQTPEQLTLRTLAKVDQLDEEIVDIKALILKTMLAASEGLDEETLSTLKSKLHETCCDYFRADNIVTPGGSYRFDLGWHTIRHGLEWDQLTQEDLKLLINRLLQTIFNTLSSATTKNDIAFHALFIEFVAIMENLAHSHPADYQALVEHTWLLFQGDLYKLNRQNPNDAQQILAKRFTHLLQAQVFSNLEKLPIPGLTLEDIALPEEEKITRGDIPYFSNIIAKALHQTRIVELTAELTR